MVNVVAPEDPSIKAYSCGFHRIRPLVKKDGSFVKLGSAGELFTHCLALFG